MANQDGVVRIDGINKLTAALKKAGDAAQDMPELMHEIGMIVVRAADPPTLSGRLAGSLRAGRGKTKAVVRAGDNNSVPYGRVQEYGWQARSIPARMFLNNARAAKKADIERTFFDGIDEILRKADLK